MAICPFAVQRLITPGENDPKIQARLAILHVDGGAAVSLFDYFRFRSGGVESHFHITWAGRIEQYRDTDYEADANYLANPFAVSIETQGFGGGRWNVLQRRAIRRLLKWIHETHDIPLRKAQRWDGTGVGYHTLFGAPGKWTPVAKSCPGPERIKQFNTWLVRWMRAQQPPNAVEVLRAALESALALEANVPTERTVVHEACGEIRTALQRMPRD